MLNLYVSQARETTVLTGMSELAYLTRMYLFAVTTHAQLIIIHNNRSFLQLSALQPLFTFSLSSSDK